MNVMILKIHEPHGWCVAEQIQEKFDTLFGIVEGTYYTCCNKPYFMIPKNVDFETLQKGLRHHFKYAHELKEFVILSDENEENNQHLIKMLKDVQLNENNYAHCLLICNDF